MARLVQKTDDEGVESSAVNLKEIVRRMILENDVCDERSDEAIDFVSTEVEETGPRSNSNSAETPVSQNSCQLGHKGTPSSDNYGESNESRHEIYSLKSQR